MNYHFASVSNGELCILHNYFKLSEVKISPISLPQIPAALLIHTRTDVREYTPDVHPLELFMKTNEAKSRLQYTAQYYTHVPYVKHYSRELLSYVL